MNVHGNIESVASPALFEDDVGTFTPPPPDVGFADFDGELFVDFDGVQLVDFS